MLAPCGIAGPPTHLLLDIVQGLRQQPQRLNGVVSVQRLVRLGA
jgi:hypothetical protein